MVEGISSDVFLIVISIAATTGIGALVAFFRNMRQCITRLSKRTWRIQKTLIIMAKMIDTQTNKQHPEVESDLDELVKEMLEEEKNGKV